MKWIATALLALGAAGFILFREPQLRWESAGAAVIGIVLLVTRHVKAQ